MEPGFDCSYLFVNRETGFLEETRFLMSIPYSSIAFIVHSVNLPKLVSTTAPNSSLAISAAINFNDILMRRAVVSFVL